MKLLIVVLLLLTRIQWLTYVRIMNFSDMNMQGLISECLKPWSNKPFFKFSNSSSLLVLDRKDISGGQPGIHLLILLVLHNQPVIPCKWVDQVLLEEKQEQNQLSVLGDQK